MGAHLKPDERCSLFLDAGLPLAEKHGYRNVTREMVAASIGCSASLLSKYWTAPEWHDAIIRRAIADENAVVIAQGLVDRNPIAISAPMSLKQAAANTLLEITI